MYDPITHRLDAQRARCGSKSPQKALPVDGVPWVRDADADCERGGSMRVVRLGGRGVHTQGSVAYAQICVPCPLNVILTACEKDLGRVLRGRLRSRCRSSGVEFESPSTIYAFKASPARIPTPKAGPRATRFPVPRSNFCRAGRTSRGDKKLSTFEPTRLRNCQKPFSQVFDLMKGHRGQRGSRI